jgi:hypothetical protein
METSNPHQPFWWLSQELLLLPPASTEIDAEAALMETLADADEDKQLDNGAVEIGSKEEYHG